MNGLLRLGEFLDMRMQIRSLACRPSMLAFAVIMTSSVLSPVFAYAQQRPFVLQCVDDATGRGIPLVEVRLTTNQVLLTDSAGRIAINDPTLFDREVYFHLSSHGYSVPADAFGYRGVKRLVSAGGSATVRMSRENIAERLYRITGAGIYRDSVMAGQGTPIKQPLLNAYVTGQDSVQAVVVGQKIYWFWGDTNRLRYPLGHFNTSGATSQLPSAGGLDPSDGINLSYVVDDEGFSRPMFDPEPGVLIWIHGATLVDSKDGSTEIVTHYSRRKNLDEQLSHGVATFDIARQRFVKSVEFANRDSLYPRGHAFRHTDRGNEYIYFADPYSRVRVPATYDAVLDPSRYEAYTPLKAGSQDVDLANLDRRPSGELRFEWKRATTPVRQDTLAQWERTGQVAPAENAFRTIAATTKQPIVLHRGSVRWNEFRQKWIMIANQLGGTSYLGEVWYSEADSPEGPFERAVKIATHRHYSFYNVTQHAFFDAERGRKIYFEGTYTKQFSQTKTPTPWYDYNQIMYRLDLSDARLKLAH